jgi:hypothetical protein
MLIVALQIIILLTSILLPLRNGKFTKKTTYRIDSDTRNSQYAINENGMLERIDNSNLQKKNN